jgi:hypothetical protein
MQASASAFWETKKKDLLHSSHIIFIETLYGGDETVKASFDLKDLLRISIGLRPCGFFL